MGEILQSIGLSPQVVLLQIISFVVLYLVLKKFLFEPIGTLIESRNREVSDRLANAERDEKAMEAVRTEYERRIAEIETEARDRIQQAITEAQRIADGIKDDARQQAEEIRERGVRQIEHEKEKAIKEIQDQVVDIAVDAAEHVVGEACDEGTHRKLIQRFLEDAKSDSLN